MSAHSQIGASSMHRWAACPGSVRLCKGLPSRSSAHADEGTKAHELAANFLEGATVERDDAELEMLLALEPYFTYCEALIADADQYWIERKFDLSAVYPGLFGTADFVALLPDHTLEVVDLKYGAGVPVDVLGNPQLRYYALGALLSLPDVLVERVRITIVQPRCPHPDGPVRTEELDYLDLLDFTNELVRAAKATEDPDAPLVPGSHCRWCPASAVCPARQRVADEAIAQDFRASPTVLADVLARVDEIEAWCKSVRAYAYDEAMVGRTPPGWKLVDKRPVRKWVDEEATVKHLYTLNYGDAEIWDMKLKSPAQIEKLFPDKAQRESLVPFTTSESSGLKLVRADDPAPEVSGVASMFSKVESQ